MTKNPRMDSEVRTLQHDSRLTAATMKTFFSTVLLSATKLGVVLFVLQGMSSEISADGPGPLPSDARLVLDEDWSDGKLNPDRWYVLRKKWGDGNHGVVPENVRVERDVVDGREKNVLACAAHGDEYDGPITGEGGNRTRVGGVVVSKDFFASGRFEVVMKIGGKERREEGPADPAQPIGTVPAIWTYGYRYVEVANTPVDEFVPDQPLYNPHMQAYGIGANEYWSELDFPEFGKEGRFDEAMYNTFCQNRHDSKLFDVHSAADGDYHSYVTEWRTELEAVSDIQDEQTVEHLGYWWICDKSIPFDRYLGNPLKRVGKEQYLLYRGLKAKHWIDGKFVGENSKFVPAMSAQLNLGVWLPKWAGAAPWQLSRVSFASVRVWQYGDAGDVRGVLTEDLQDNLDRSCNRLE